MGGHYASMARSRRRQSPLSQGRQRAHRAPRGSRHGPTAGGSEEKIVTAPSDPSPLGQSPPMGWQCRCYPPPRLGSVRAPRQPQEGQGVPDPRAPPPPPFGGTRTLERTALGARPRRTHSGRRRSCRHPLSVPGLEAWTEWRQWYGEREQREGDRKKGGRGRRMPAGVRAIGPGGQATTGRTRPRGHGRRCNTTPLSERAGKRGCQYTHPGVPAHGRRRTRQVLPHRRSGVPSRRPVRQGQMGRAAEKRRRRAGGGTQWPPTSHHRHPAPRDDGEKQERQSHRGSTRLWVRVGPTAPPLPLSGITTTSGSGQTMGLPNAAQTRADGSNPRGASKGCGRRASATSVQRPRSQTGAALRCRRPQTCWRRRRSALSPLPPPPPRTTPQRSPPPRARRSRPRRPWRRGCGGRPVQPPPPRYPQLAAAATGRWPPRLSCRRRRRRRRAALGELPPPLPLTR